MRLKSWIRRSFRNRTFATILIATLLPLLLSRLLHLPLSLLLFGLLAKLFPMALSAGAQWDASPLLAVRMPPEVMLILFAMAALACGALPVPRYLRRR